MVLSCSAMGETEDMKEANIGKRTCNLQNHSSTAQVRFSKEFALGQPLFHKFPYNSYSYGLNDFHSVCVLVTTFILRNSTSKGVHTHGTVRMVFLFYFLSKNCFSNKNWVFYFFFISSLNCLIIICSMFFAVTLHLQWLYLFTNYKHFKHIRSCLC